jgi:hypothetical protein
MLQRKGAMTVLVAHSRAEQGVLHVAAAAAPASVAGFHHAFPMFARSTPNLSTRVCATSFSTVTWALPTTQGKLLVQLVKANLPPGRARVGIVMWPISMSC